LASTRQVRQSVGRKTTSAISPYFQKCGEMTRSILLDLKSIG
jgi:hypothetical protein